MAAKLLTLTSGITMIFMSWKMPPSVPVLLSKEELALYPFPLRVVYPAKSFIFDFLYRQLAPTHSSWERLNLAPFVAGATTSQRLSGFAIIGLDFFFMMGYSAWLGSWSSFFAALADAMETSILLFLALRPRPVGLLWAWCRRFSVVKFVFLGAATALSLMSLMA